MLLSLSCLLPWGQTQGLALGTALGSPRAKLDRPASQYQVCPLLVAGGRGHVVEAGIEAQLAWDVSKTKSR